MFFKETKGHKNMIIHVVEHSGILRRIFVGQKIRVKRLKEKEEVIEVTFQ